MNTIVAINPGTQAVKGIEDYAAANMEVFRIDVLHQLNGWDNENTIQRCADRDTGDGRYAYQLTYTVPETTPCCVLVHMPGLPLARVRYQDGCNAWLFPRLYVNGDSWLWTYAVETAVDALTGVNNE